MTSSPKRSGSSALSQGGAPLGSPAEECPTLPGNAPASRLGHRPLGAQAARKLGKRSLTQTRVTAAEMQGWKVLALGADHTATRLVKLNALGCRLDLRLPRTRWLWRRALSFHLSLGALRPGCGLMGPGLAGHPAADLAPALALASLAALGRVPYSCAARFQSASSPPGQEKAIKPEALLPSLFW